MLQVGSQRQHYNSKCQTLQQKSSIKLFTHDSPDAPLLIRGREGQSSCCTSDRDVIQCTVAGAPLNVLRFHHPSHDSSIFLSYRCMDLPFNGHTGSSTFWNITMHLEFGFCSLSIPAWYMIFKWLWLGHLKHSQMILIMIWHFHNRVIQGKLQFSVVTILKSCLLCSSHLNSNTFLLILTNNWMLWKSYKAHKMILA